MVQYIKCKMKNKSGENERGMENTSQLVRGLEYRVVHVQFQLQESNPSLNPFSDYYFNTLD